MIITPKSHTTAIKRALKAVTTQIIFLQPGSHEAELAKELARELTKELERYRHKSLIEIIDRILLELAKALEAMDDGESHPRTNSKLIGKTA